MALIRQDNPPVDYLRSCFSYDPETGVFRWLSRSDMPVAWNRKMAGKVAGSVNAKTGQINLRVKWIGRTYRMLAHRVAWAMFYGYWPEHIIDHRDLNPSNNRILNLRPANFSLNGGNATGKNATSGFKGVHSWNNRYVAHIRKDGKQYHLGYFRDAVSAARAYDTAAVSAFGSYALTNFSGARVDKQLVRRFEIGSLA